MEIKTLKYGWPLLLLLLSCERPLYFASSETHMISRLDNKGDVQGQLAVNQSLQSIMTYQASAAIALTKHLALRGSWLRGGDDFSVNQLDYGRLSATHLGAGGLYKIPKWNLSASTWLGYSEGSVLNVNRVSLFSEIPETVRLTNNFRRLFVEQQIRYHFQAIEIFGTLSLGNSHLFGFNLAGEPRAESDFLRDYTYHKNNPSAFFGNLGYGISAGSRNIRVQFRIDQLFGSGLGQFNQASSLFFTTGLCLRLEGSRWLTAFQ